MNSFGRLFRIILFGESHGPAVGVVIDGCPAGLRLAPADFDGDLSRRRAGRPGTSARREPDVPKILSGLLENRTTGAPLLIRFANEDTDAAAYEAIKDTPRPGQADLVSRRKYGGFSDLRGGGHFSGRLTVGLVAAGVVAKKIIRPAAVAARLVEAGGETDIEGAVAAAVADGDSVGGIVAVEVRDLPAGLGEPFFDAAESVIAHLVLAVPAVRGIEFGAGFRAARMRGSEHNDPILDARGTTATNHAGGISGGITNGNPLLFRLAVKPTPTIPRPQATVDLRTGETREILFPGRHDACLALRLPVVIEAVTSIALADLMLLDGQRRRVMGEL